VNRRLALARAVLVRFGYALGRLTPVRRRVVLATSHTDRLGPNLAAIRRGIGDRLPGIPVVVLARGLRSGWRSQVLAIVDAVVAGWHLATARLFLVDDYYFPMYVIPRRPGTRFVQVWHACGAFKKFGYSVLTKRFGADEAFVDAVPIHANYDLCLVSAARVAPCYAEAFRQPLERFTSRLGIPRTDLFFDEARMAAARAAIRARYTIPDGRRVLLFAPTFRGERVTEARTPDDLDLVALRQGLGDDWLVLLRAHPFVRARLRVGPDLAGFVVDVSDWPDLNELMLVSDVLVTDYSSAIFEFALLERPIAFFAPDHAEYEHERGFYLDFPGDLPGPVFETTEALAEHLRAGSFDLDRVRRFRDESFDVADGRATERFVEEVIRPAVGGRHPASLPRRLARAAWRATGRLVGRPFSSRGASEVALRDAIATAGGSLRPRPPEVVWQPWLNRALRTSDEVATAEAALRAAGLVPHQDRPKNWDALVALGTILERTPRSRRVLEMGAASYSPLLRWLYLYGYRSLVGIDLVYQRPVRRGPIRWLPMDLTATSFDDGAFGAIACLSVIEHGVDMEAYLREASRLLAPGGVLITSTDYWPTRLDTRGREAYGHPVHVFDRAEVEGLVAAAASHGLRPLTSLDLDAVEPVVRWDRMDLDYTFVNVVLARQP
jgi:CDP-ribitol ribitolphosphotransferase